VPLGPQGERLLDVIASVGGTRQPVLKTTIQIARNSQLVSMPLESVIRDPRQNVRLKAGDVVTALFQPYSFTALGATGRNEEVPFEATGLTLSQALGRASGLQDTRSDAKGVFIFRFEPAQALAGQSAVTTTPLPNGTVPVIYRLNLRDPRSLFIAQTFPIRDKDVLYVSNAPITDVQKVVNIIFSALLPITTAVSIVP
jgi:polysaccharide export outer membrane protein